MVGSITWDFQPYAWTNLLYKNDTLPAPKRNCKIKQMNTVCILISSSVD